MNIIETLKGITITSFLTVSAYAIWQHYDEHIAIKPVEVYGVEYTKLTSVELVKTPKLSNDIECLTANLYYEARGEGKAGMIAVANVVINRVKSSKFADGVCAVVYQPNAFSWVKKGYDSLDDEKSAKLAEFIARKAIKGTLSDTTKGADHYLALDKLKKKPTWAKGMKQTTKIGNHTFYASNTK